MAASAYEALLEPPPTTSAGSPYDALLSAPPSPAAPAAPDPYAALISAASEDQSMPGTQEPVSEARRADVQAYLDQPHVQHTNETLEDLAHKTPNWVRDAVDSVIPDNPATTGAISKALDVTGIGKILSYAMGEKDYNEMQQGFAESVGEMAKGLLTPFGIGSIVGLSRAPAAIQKTAALLFSANILKHEPDLLANIKNATTTRERSKAVMDFIGQNAMGIGGLKYGMGREGVFGRTTAPLTTAALNATKPTHEHSTAISDSPGSSQGDAAQLEAGHGGSGQVQGSGGVSTLQRDPAQLQQAVGGQQQRGGPAESLSEPAQLAPETTAVAAEVLPKGSGKVTQLLDRRQKTSDPAERQRLWDEAQAQLKLEQGGAPETKATEPAPKPSEPVSAPVETPPSEPIVTSTKNAVVDAERTARGQQPLEAGEHVSNADTWKAAEERLKQSPTAGADLVTELNEKPRPITSVENDILLRHKIATHAEGKRLIEEANKPDITDAGKAALRTQIELNDQAVDAIDTALKSGGTETGRALAARRSMADQDYELVTMRAKLRAVKGKPLTPAEETKLSDISSKIKETQKSADEKTQAAKDAHAADDNFSELLKTLRNEAKESSKKGSKVTDFLHEQAEKARARIKARGARLNAGLNPIELADHIIIGAEHIANGIVKLADFTKKLVDEFGEAIRPFAKDIHEKSKAYAAAAKEEGKPVRTDEQKRLARYKTTVAKRTEELRRRIADRDFSKREKRTLELDKEAQQARFANEKAKGEYHAALLDAQRAARTPTQKAFGFVGDTLDTARAVKTAADLSAVLRQGGFIAYGHPIRAAKAFPAMFRAFKSESNMHAVTEEIRNRPNAPLYKSSKLYLADEGGAHTINKQEEAFRSRWANKIPLVAGSQRAYTAFLNRLRADSFDAMTATLGRRGTVTAEEANAIANFINVATGRGDVGKAAAAANAMNNIFFAPRFVTSRFQLLAGQPFYRGTARTRTLVAQEYAKMLGGAAVVYGLLSMMRGKDDPPIELDPRSTNFGKIQVGDTHIDPMFGLIQPTVFTSRMVTGETKKGNGAIQSLRGEDVPFGGDDSADVLARFLRTKLSPTAGSIVNVAAGRDVAGNPTSLGKEALLLPAPISLMDIYQIMEAQGYEKGTIISLLNLFGMSSNTYQDRK
jgi:hypothetical protein